MSRPGLILSGVLFLTVGRPAVAEEPPRLPEFDFSRNGTQTAEASQSSQQPIPLHRNPQLQNGETDDGQAEGGLPSLGTVLTALGVVVLLMLGVAKMLGKNAAVNSGRTISPVDVLYRRSLDTKNSISIVRVGPRLLVLGSSAGGLTTLAEITDPVEVEALSIELRAASEASNGALGFVARWLDRSSQEPVETASTPAPKTTVSPHDSVAGLTVREVEEGHRAA